MSVPMVRNLRRVMRDYEALLRDGPENGIWIKPAVPDCLDLFYVMLRGPAGPYEGSLFFFTLEPWVAYNAGDNSTGLTYPATPPRVLHQSPWSIRSHPNLYQTGGDWSEHSRNGGAKVCLSILGTWAGPGWTPMYTFMHIFQTILSILDNEPLRNEPAYERGNNPLIPAYTKYVQYVTLHETFERVFLPVLAKTLSVSNIPYLKLFEQEIHDIWKTKRSWYFDHARTLESQNTIVQGATYGDKKYIGNPYKFTSLNKLMELTS